MYSGRNSGTGAEGFQNSSLSFLAPKEGIIFSSRRQWPSGLTTAETLQESALREVPSCVSWADGNLLPASATRLAGVIEETESAEGTVFQLIAE